LFDLMPVEPEVLGFSNRWYRYAVETAQPVDLGGGITIRLVSAVGFVATKLEAFADRGSGDILASHDLEDILTVVDGRAELAVELSAAPAEVREAVSRAFASMLADEDFANALPGLLAEPERAPVVVARMKEMIG
jgi:predicted nucleotidyltransferase